MIDNGIPSAQLGTAPLRVGVGLVFLIHGLMKIFVFTVPGTMGFFEAVGFPGILAIPVIVVEVVGGVLLVLGLGTRWLALAMVPIALGATSAHWGNGFTFTNPNGGWEYPAFLALTSLALFLYGDDGRLALGSALQRRQPVVTTDADLQSTA